MTLQLTVISLDFDSDTTPTTKSYEQDEVTIGRSPANDVVLDRPEVSGKHLRVRVDHSDGEARLFVTDLGSLNGTMVENELIEPQVEKEVLSNQRIIIGTYLIQPLVLDEDGATLQGTYEDYESTRGNGVRTEVLDDEPEVDLQDSQTLLGADLSEDTHDGETVVADEAATAASVEQSDEGTSTFSRKRRRGSAAEAYVPKFRPAEPKAPEPEPEPARPRGFLYVEEPVKTRPIVEQEPPQAVKVRPFAPEEPEAVEEDPSVEEPTMEFEPQETQASAAAEPPVSGRLGLDDVRELNFEGVALYTLSGVVLHRGKPLAGVEIDAGDLGRRVTQSDGAFFFAEVEEGTRFAVEAEKEKFVLDCKGASGVLEADTRLEVIAKELFKIGGRVMLRDQGLADVAVATPGCDDVETDADGRFEFPSVVEGTHYDLSFQKDRFRFECGAAAGTLSGDLSVVVKAVKLLTIEGVVRHRGVPIADVEVDAGPLGKTTTDSEGRYRFENVPDGTDYSIILTKPGYKFAPAR